MPLTRIVGPVILLIEVVFVTLSMGMGTVHFSLSLFNLVKERLPQPVSDLQDGDLPKRLNGSTKHFSICLTPIIIAFGVTEISLLWHFGSFTGFLSFWGQYLAHCLPAFIQFG